MSGSSSRTERSPFQYPSSKRPSIYRSGNRNVARMGESPLVRPGVQRVNSPLRRTKEVQTLLTFPHDLDLVKLLGGRFQFNEEEGGAEEGVSEANLSLNSLRRKLFADYDSSFSSKGNDSDSLNATRNSASPEPLKFDEECNIANDEPSEGDYLESDISACDGDTPASSVRRRRMVSPDMSPIRFLS
ncbi:hypothetical protein Tcan_09303 [Toxocara canis]|nr:hypothetical protein Tcan_09303 [Toxocara canis]